MSEQLHTVLLGAEVDVAPDQSVPPVDNFHGTGIIACVWTSPIGPDGMRVPCHSVLFLDGGLAPIVAHDRLTIIKIRQLPYRELLNRDGDA